MSVTIVVSASNVRTILAEVTDVSKGIVTWYSPQDKLSLLYVQEPAELDGAGAGVSIVAPEIRFLIYQSKLCRLLALISYLHHHQIGIEQQVGWCSELP